MNIAWLTDRCTLNLQYICPQCFNFAACIEHTYGKIERIEVTNATPTAIPIQYDAQGWPYIEYSIAAADDNRC